MEKISEKCTKSTIYSAFKETLSNYNKLAKEKASLQSKIKELEKKELYNSVENPKALNLSTAVKTFAASAQALEIALEQTKEHFKKADQAVKEKEEDLQELYGIEKSCNTFIALKEAQEKEKELFEEEKEKRMEEANDKIKQYHDRIGEMEEAHKKKVDETIYSHNMEKKKLRDELEFTKQQIKREIEMLKEDMDKGREEFEKEKKAFEATKEAFEESTKELAEAMKEKHKKAIEAISRENKLKIESNEVKYQSEIEKKNYQVSLLEAKVDDLQVENTNLNAKVEQAYGKLQELAKETVNSKSKDELIDKLSAVAKKSNNN
jgi:chromosome segregation ATPase